MDASQYKDYVLTLLFVKYVSDKFAGRQDSLVEVPEGGSFADMVAVKGDAEIGDKINKIIARLADANELRGVIDVADFNDDDKLGRGKEMVDRLTKLVSIFEAVDFRGNRAEGDDLLGDAYEYLMKNFATESGKSKGQFYTPAEVSRVMASLVGIGPETKQDQTLYDPTCGSGSLLLKGSVEAPRGLTIYGQEIDVATWALAKMNMILHGQPTAELWRGNTLADPYFKNADGSLKTFDFAVANPPFSSKAWASGLDPDNDQFGRFELGIPPERNGDYAFLLHLIKSLKSTGKAAIILPHGVLFRGNREADIRRNLLQRGLIRAVIGLPANLFYGTGIPACILVIDKENAHASSGVFMIDASKGFMKDGAKNRLRDRDIHKIVDVFTKQETLVRYSRMVPLSEIADPKNDYNLSIPRYIDSSEPEDVQDLQAHIRGGIPEQDIDALASYWAAFPQLRGRLFKWSRGGSGYVDLAIPPDEVQRVVVESPEFREFAHSVETLFAEWWAQHRPDLMAIDSGTLPNELAGRIGEDLLCRFESVPLLDFYDVYEQWMAYWHDVMHDDVALIVHGGWINAARPRHAISDKARKITEVPDLEVGVGRNRARYKMDLIPPSLVVGRYFAFDRGQLEALSAAAEFASEAVEEYAEEQGGEEGLLSDALNVRGQLTQSMAKEALRAAKALTDNEAVRCIQTALDLLQAEAAAKRAANDAQAALDAKTIKQYSNLAERDVQELAVDDKWGTALRQRLAEEVDSLTLALVARIRLLGDRYAETVGELDGNLRSLEAALAEQLLLLGIKP